MRYQFRVRGHLDPQWSIWLDGLNIHHDNDGTSALYGDIRDQAALYGLVMRLRDLGVELIAIIPEDAPSTSSEVQ